ncbi:hypothetical protein DFS34DRAFT_654409 [Phlyctochytrium arcticum]|nr:hypothetical protein DFS34DRAFT_654409 [Phlyctochytrium arcticum]
MDTLHRNKRFENVRVSTAGCEFVADFLVAVNSHFPHILAACGLAQLSLFDPDGTTTTGYHNTTTVVDCVDLSWKIEEVLGYGGSYNVKFLNPGPRKKNKVGTVAKLSRRDLQRPPDHVKIEDLLRHTDNTTKEHWEIECVLAQRKDPDTSLWEALIKWKGFSSDFVGWEPENHMNWAGIDNWNDVTDLAHLTNDEEAIDDAVNQIMGVVRLAENNDEYLSSGDDTTLLSLKTEPTYAATRTIVMTVSEKHPIKGTGLNLLQHQLDPTQPLLFLSVVPGDKFESFSKQSLLTTDGHPYQNPTGIVKRITQHALELDVAMPVVAETYGWDILSMRDSLD